MCSPNIKKNIMTLTIENIPPQLYTELKKEATLYHRSLTQQALCFLEQGMKTIGKSTVVVKLDEKTQWLKPIKPISPINNESVVSIIREARDARAINENVIGNTL
jgi:hypothetical protein